MGKGAQEPPAGSPEGAIQGIYAVGGPDDDHLPPGVQAIHQRQQRAHDAVVDLVLLAAPHLAPGQMGSAPALSAGQGEN